MKNRQGQEETSLSAIPQTVISSLRLFTSPVARIIHQGEDVDILSHANKHISCAMGVGSVRLLHLLYSSVSIFVQPSCKDPRSKACSSHVLV